VNVGAFLVGGAALSRTAGDGGVRGVASTLKFRLAGVGSVLLAGPVVSHLEGVLAV
jgi:hypothetical protein